MASKTFECADCGQEKPIQTSGGTGYAVTDEGTVCYACCGKRDAEYMRDHGRHSALYLVEVDGRPHLVVNWPSTLTFRVGSYRFGRHNMGGKRTDVWFAGPDGHTWHGVHIGENSQIVRCRRTKGR